MMGRFQQRISRLSILLIAAAVVVFNVIPTPVVSAQDSADSTPPMGILYPAVLTAMQQVDDSRYAFEQVSDDHYRVVNPSQNLQVEFDRSGFDVRPADDGDAAWSVRLNVIGYGYGEQIEPIDAGTFVQNDARLEHTRGALTEWYTNGALGLQQGFTLASPPSGTGEADLVLAFSADGSYTSVSADGDSLNFRDLDGASLLRYGNLYVYDAVGATLPSRFEVRDGQPLIAVDDHDAVYPITIDPFVQQGSLSPSYPTANDHFGYSIDVSNSTVLIGVPDNDNLGVNSGAAYVFTRNDTGSEWTKRGQLTGNNSVAGDRFGSAVATNDYTLIIGAPGMNNGQGAAYIYDLKTEGWKQTVMITAPDGAAGDEFGYSVAISGDNVVIGAPGNGAGAAYIFHLDANTQLWSQSAALSGSDAASGDRVGTAVAITSYGGGMVAVGAPGDDEFAVNAGSVYMFQQDGVSWLEDGELTANAMTAGDANAGDAFGASVSLHTTTALIGAPGDDGSGANAGAAYTWLQSGSVWTPLVKLTAGDAAAEDQFGTDVDIFTNYLLMIGAPGNDDSGESSGSAYVFTGSSDVWSQSKKLIAADASSGDRFGAAVTIMDTFAYAASPGANAPDSDTGAVYGFSWSQNWSQTRKLDGHSNVTESHFGYAIALDGDTAVISSQKHIDYFSPTTIVEPTVTIFVWQDNTWTEQARLTGNSLPNFGRDIALSGDTLLISGDGTVYIYMRSGTSWTHQAALLPDVTNDNFGARVAVDGDTAIIGGGSLVYVFTRSGSTWTQRATFPHETTSALDIEGTRFVVGDMGHSVDGGVFIYDWNGSSWGLEATFVPPWDTSVALLHFGVSVGLSGDTVVVGEPRGGNGASEAGAAFVYVKSGETWTEQAVLYASDAQPQDHFGEKVAVEGDTIVIAAPDNSVTSAPGTLYVFAREGNAWTEVQRFGRTGTDSFTYLGERLALDNNRVMASGSKSGSGAASHNGVVYYFDVVPGADLSVNVTLSDPPIRSGDIITYSHTITNWGPDTAHNLVLTDTFSGVSSLESATVRAASGAEEQMMRDTVQDETIECETVDDSYICPLGDLEANYQITLDVSFQISPTFVGILTNNALVEADEYEIDPSDNSATLNTNVNPPVTPIAAPALSLPPNNALLNISQPQFTWQAVASGDLYQIQITSGTTSFTTPVVNEVVDVLTYTPFVILADGTYSWRVRAQSSIGEPGPWSTVRTVRIDATPPHPPALTAPMDDSVTTIVRPVFTWGSASGAVRYELQLDTFDPPQETVLSANVRTYTPPTPLLQTAVYTWRVRAIDAAGNISDWSPPWSFQINSSASAVPNRNRYSTRTPELRWSELTWALGYEIQVDNNADFSSPIFSNNAIGATMLSQVVTTPLPDGIYYWRVRAKRTGTQWGAWSSADTFAVDAGAP